MASTRSRLSEASATCLICSGRLFRPSCCDFHRLSLVPELGGDHHFPAERSQRFAHEFFVGEWTIDFSRIEEGDATLNRRVKKSDHLLLVGNRVFIMAHPHAAEPESRNFQAAFSKFSFLHFLNSFVEQVNASFNGKIPSPGR